MKTQTKLNKRERKAQALLAHYATCERLASRLGYPGRDGKKISVELWKCERDASRMHLNQLNDPKAVVSYDALDAFDAAVTARVKKALGAVPPGFFVNRDSRGYALQIDCDAPDGMAVIEGAELRRNMGGNGVLSPAIEG